MASNILSYYMVKCFKCKTTRRFNVAMHNNSRIELSEKIMAAPSCCERCDMLKRYNAARPWAMADGFKVRQLLGSKNDSPCNAKCTSATGNSCECGCGGENHGADHAA